MCASLSLIPADPLTRKLLAKISMELIKEDPEKARAGGTGRQANTPDAAVDATHQAQGNTEHEKRQEAQK